MKKYQMLKVQELSAKCTDSIKVKLVFWHNGPLCVSANI